MKRFLSGLFVLCVIMEFTITTSSDVDADTNQYQSPTGPQQGQLNTVFDGEDVVEDQSVVNDADQVKLRSLQSKPLRSIVMGIYKNYKSTYLGNKTLTEYKQTLREAIKTRQKLSQSNVSGASSSVEADIPAEADKAKEDGDVEDGLVADASEEFGASTTTTEPANEITLTTEQANAHEQHYDIGPALNVSLDLNNNVVRVTLDGESLKELVTSRWLNDNSDEGRGKKYEMVTRILPLFILPFLIQSAIVPFLVTKLKLLLMKSMLVGKLAIFLLIISAFRNSNKMMQTYEVAPSYWAGEPSRRSEMAAAASNMAYNGYRVEGKPAAWVN